MFKRLRQKIKEINPVGRARAQLAARHVSSRDVQLMDSKLSGWYLDDGQLCERFRVSREDTVVDVGCGRGSTTKFCADQGAAVIATDIDPESVESTRQRIANSPARSFQAIVSDSNPLPLEDGVATKVICNEVLEHVEDPQQVMSELFRIGKPGTQYLITVPDPVGESIQREIAAPVYWERPNHLRVFGREEFEDLVKSAGLQIEHRSSAGFYWSVWWILFWASQQEYGETEGPLLKSWTKTWHALITTPKSTHIKKALDDFMPKSQVLVARKAA